jgi:hypothetical protein
VYIQYQNISNGSWICQKLAAEHPQTRASGAVRQGRRHGLSITYKITPCWAVVGTDDLKRKQSATFNDLQLSKNIGSMNLAVFAGADLMVS